MADTRPSDLCHGRRTGRQPNPQIRDPRVALVIAQRFQEHGGPLAWQTPCQTPNLWPGGPESRDERRLARTRAHAKSGVGRGL